jgi:zinc transport system ATP-binding protein
MSILTAENINFFRNERHLLQDISFVIEDKKIVTLIGPNGCGKSTLIKLLLGLIPLTSGRIHITQKMSIGYVPQKLRIDQRMPLSIKNFLELAPKKNNRSHSKMHYWMDVLSISHLMHQHVDHLSGGEWQRVLLTRALLCNPKLLVLDEPIQGIDIQGQLELYSLLPKIRDELGCAILIVSHDLHLVMSATDHVICLNGHICCSGHPNDVSSDPVFNHLFKTTTQDVPLTTYTHHHDHIHDASSFSNPCRNQSKQDKEL